MAAKDDCFCGQHSGHVSEINTCVESRKQNIKDHEVIFSLINRKVSMTLFLWVMGIVVIVLGGVFTSQMRMYETMNGMAKDIAVIMERTGHENKSR